MTQETDIATVLELVQNQSADRVEVDIPDPPAGSSDRAAELWRAILGAYELTVGEMLVLEQLCAAQTMHDELLADWRADGAPMQTVGSMGQMVTDGRVQEMRLVKAQVQSLVKSLALPAENAEQRRRPGRPSRSDGGGRWGVGNG